MINYQKYWTESIALTTISFFVPLTGPEKQSLFISYTFRFLADFVVYCTWFLSFPFHVLIFCIPFLFFFSIFIFLFRFCFRFHVSIFIQFLLLLSLFFYVPSFSPYTQLSLLVHFNSLIYFLQFSCRTSWESVIAKGLTLFDIKKTFCFTISQKQPYF